MNIHLNYFEELGFLVLIGVSGLLRIMTSSLSMTIYFWYPFFLWGASSKSIHLVSCYGFKGNITLGMISPLLLIHNIAN